MRTTFKRPIYTICGFVILLIFCFLYFTIKRESYNEITTFEDCFSTGYEILATYPEVCSMPGKRFVNPKQKVEKSPIEVSTTTESQESISAVETYFIEGQKVVLQNGTGTLLFSDGKHQVPLEVSTLPNQKLSYDGNNDVKADSALLLQVKVPSLSIKQSVQLRYYLVSSLSGYTSQIGTNAVYVDNDIASTSFVYKNGEINLHYTTITSTSTKVKHYTLVNNFIKEIIDSLHKNNHE